MSDKKLRFAPLIRVSTEAQEKRGESLNVQREQIQKWVHELGGTIPKKLSKKYSAQEHSTPDAERKILDTLLADAQDGLFDAVIVADVSRWARDNLKSEQGLKTLKENGIQFFVGGMEFDLHNPLHKFMLSSNVGMSELYAMTLAERSLQGKIKKLQANIPATGKLPFGRTFDKETKKWGIDPEKKKKVELAADMMLSGSTVEAIQEATGMSSALIYKLFSDGKAGDKFPVKIKPKLFPKMEQTFELNVPPLLPKKTLTALKKKLERGKAFYHRNHNRKKFLLSKMLFCGHCGYALSGAAVGPKARRYYFHQRLAGKSKIVCDGNFRSCSAKPLEEAVMGVLFETFGDAKKRSELLHVQIPKGAKAVEAKLVKAEKDLKKNELSQSRLVKAVEEGTLPANSIKTRMNELAQEAEEIKSRISELNKEMEGIPREEELSAMEKALAKSIEYAWLGTHDRLEQMTFEEKRDMLRTLFGGVTKHPSGNKKLGEKMTKFVKHGIYIKRGKKQGSWTFEIRGSFPMITGAVSPSHKIDLKEPLF